MRGSFKVSFCYTRLRDGLVYVHRVGFAGDRLGFVTVALSLLFVAVVADDSECDGAADAAAFKRVLFGTATI